ncbi:adenylosuccinate synthetase [Wigglesworthia glossinidia endosymbiont of Glossina morsitans morsitans (Yale colony)]|uniref:Adenylosuccinate synthetase n=1 Tax=Wigglesworthia glossinidia endosymbiont of Glossina morsitans morsitans (Yale colony) TaxID=1142511 RepID=H6Q5D5_WIGGL|nr:adenylosuccinate synthase [Wigglesworthia glossinidia]AFA41418.1 adenylosuccinate synthetase [Wigglesworthia glossinidia endosymbiont of Glossina morsitans morsitans (Yale colony)]
MKKNIVILGAQWGDEGKGKIIDFLSQKIRYVIRCQGGNNAGHTIVIKNKKIVLHLIPSSILNKKTINIISSGVVVSLDALVSEIRMLENNQVDLKNRIFISALCPLVLPCHIAIDIAREKNNKNTIHIGTTKCGIGPAYEDKIARRALRINDLFNEKKLKYKLKIIMDYYNFQLVNYYRVNSISYEENFERLIQYSKILKSMIIDIPNFLKIATKNHESIMFEGAQGALLDIDYGTYPYVTSSNTTIGGIISSTGFSPFKIDSILGILKAYSTRVGKGPFPTEIFNEISNILLTKGKEFGSTTGRNRRIGWFDVVAVKRSIQLNSFSEFCLTKIDVLDNLQELKICIAYKFPKNFQFNNINYSEYWSYAKPIYESMPGWNSKTHGIKKFDNLPVLAQNYIKRIEDLIKIPIKMISTGSERNDIIVL